MSDVSGGLGIPGVEGLMEIGRSAAAVTYRARDAASGRSIIVKVLNREATDPVQRRFEYDQGRIAELVDHPNIVAVFRHGYTSGNLPYVVAEDVTGGSMADKVGSGLDGPGVVALGIRVAGALESAHRSEVVHGDLRPDDILVNAEGEPMVGDFGVVTVTGLGPDRSDDPIRLAHAAPEQLEVHSPTRESDVYALGSVLYALLAGTPAFVKPTDISVTPVIKRITADPAPDLRPHNVPDQIADIIDRAMAKNPAERYSSAEQFGRAMQQAQIALGLPITEMTILGTAPVKEKPAPPSGGPPAGGPPSGGPPAGGPPPGGPPLGAPSGGPPGGGPPSGGPPSGPPGGPPGAAKPKSKVPLIVGAVLAVALIAGGVIAFSGGGDEEPPDRTRDDEEETTTNTTEPELEFATATDDLGFITVNVPVEWTAAGGGETNGVPLTDNAFNVATPSPDILAATDVQGFIGGLHASGIEVTAVNTQAVNTANGVDVTNANILLDIQIGVQRGAGTIVDLCASDGARQSFTAGEFQGLIQRFDDCDGTDDDVVLFVGSDAAATRTIIVEIHLVVAEDEAAFDDVLQSIVVNGVP